MENVLKEAIKFFEDEIYQFNIELGGVLKKDYREYLENKKSYYELASKAIQKLKGEVNLQKIRIKYANQLLERIKKINVGDWVDLRCSEDIELKAGEFRLIPLGVAMQLPDGYEAHVVPRSSTFKNYGIIQTNSMGVIDESYCGDNDFWFFPAYALRDTKINFNDRICQFRIMEHQPSINFEEVKVLDNKDRGGHGSTGIN